MADGQSKALSWQELFDDQTDGMLMVTAQSAEVVPLAERKAFKHEAYWSVLRLCAALGMISGRGVRREINPDFARYFQTALTPGRSATPS